MKECDGGDISSTRRFARKKNKRRRGRYYQLFPVIDEWQVEITEKTRCVPPYKCVCDDETGAFTSLRKGVRTSPKVNSCLFLLSFIDNLSDTYAIGVANTGLSEQESAQRFEWDWRKKISHLRYVYAVYVCVIYIPMRGPGSSMYNVECDSSEMSTKNKNAQ